LIPILLEEKIREAERLEPEEGLELFERATLDELEELANIRREELNGDVVYFNHNFHLEPTNRCVYDCLFCSYSRALKDKNESWELSEDEILSKVKLFDNKPVTEIHIVGGVHPSLDLKFFGRVLTQIKQHRPELHIKAFTAVELHYMCKLAKVSYEQGLRYLIECGLQSIPGGGAEIFSAEIREQICGDKCTADQWLEIHRIAHNLGLKSNATMLYGHLESYEHRVDHMERLRQLQDTTGGFQAFIPLKFRNKNNQLSHLNELPEEEDLKVYAVARLYLDNIKHLKAYWPMLGRQVAQHSLKFGVDDLDGTIDDTTRIYSMAGSEEQSPSLTTEELVALIHSAGRDAVERDTLYNVITRHPLRSAQREDKGGDLLAR
jgi:aminodeoxyfutalosine synthase